MADQKRLIPFNTTDDGLFSNPNNDTLFAIKEDTGAIREVLDRNGGILLEKMAKAEKQQRISERKTRKENKQLLEATKAGILLAEKQEKAQRKTDSSKKAHNRSNLAIAQKTSIHQATDKNSVKQAKHAQKQAKNLNALTEIENKTEKAIEKRKKQAKKQLTKAAQTQGLPNGWVTDENGRIRDKNGRYVSKRLLKKHGLDNRTNNDKERVNTTKDEAERRSLLDAITGVKEAIEAPEELDPMLDAFKELSEPLSQGYDFAQKTLEVAGVGLGKIFGSKSDDVQENAEPPKTERWQDKMLNLFRKQSKIDEKQNVKVVDWLKRIWKKENGSGKSWFGKILGALAAISTAIGGIPFALGKGLLGGVNAKLGGFVKLFRRIPILGSLIAGYQMIDGFNDDTRDENGRSNRGKKIGGGVGMLLGGALGAFLGPVGAIVGALLGDFLGEIIGAWVADLDWSVVGQYISEKWKSVLEYIDELWRQTTQWLSQKWESVTLFFTESWKRALDWIRSTWEEWGKTFKTLWTETTDFISSGWKWVTDKFAKIWDGIVSFLKSMLPDFVVNGWETAKEWGGVAKNKASEWGNQAVDFGTKVAKGVKESVTNAVENVERFFSDLFSANETSNDLLNENNTQADESHKLQSDGNAFLGSIWKSIKSIPDYLSNGFDNVVKAISALNLTTEITSNYAIDENGIPQDSSVHYIDESMAKAADYAIKNAATQSLGECAKYVNDALRSQGIKIHGHGKDVATNLINSGQGFEQVAYSKDYIPQIGDVMSMGSYQGSKHNYGHVAIYTQNGWVSDFKQKDRKNTAAANDKYLSDIEAGIIKPVIARRKATNAIAVTTNKNENYRKTGKGKSFGQDVDSYISETATRYGFDEAMLRGFVQMEGGWNNEKSATGAIGVGQFTQGAWDDLAKTKEGQAIGMTVIENRFGTKDDPRYNKRINTLATGLLAKRNAKILQNSGIPITGENLYMAHNMGAGFVRAIYGKQAFTKDTRRNMDVNGGKGMNATQFMAYQKGRFNKAYQIANKGVEAKGRREENISTIASFAEPKSISVATTEVPAFHYSTNTIQQAVQNAQKNAEQIQQNAKAEREKSKMVEQQKADTQTPSNTTFDPAFQFLTQDISDRFIAHIATGGVARYNARG